MTIQEPLILKPTNYSFENGYGNLKTDLAKLAGDPRVVTVTIHGEPAVMPPVSALKGSNYTSADFLKLYPDPINFVKKSSKDEREKLVGILSEWCSEAKKVCPYNEATEDLAHDFGNLAHGSLTATVGVFGASPVLGLLGIARMVEGTAGILLDVISGGNIVEAIRGKDIRANYGAALNLAQH